MAAHTDPLGSRVRALLGQARLVYWDDAALSETLQGLLDRLEEPLRAAVDASSAPPEVAAEPEDADPSRALGVLGDLRQLLNEHPRHGSDKVSLDAERLEAFAPERREWAATLDLRGGAVVGIGRAGAARALAVLDAARHPDRDVHRPRVPELDGELAFWRAAAQDPTLPRASRAIAETVARACERLLAVAPAGRPSGPVADQSA